MRCVVKAALLVMVLLGADTLVASTLTYSVTSGAGTYEYLFTLTNDGPDPLFELFLRVPTDPGNIPASTAGDGSGWVAPTGWDMFFSIGQDVGDTTFLDWPDGGPAYDLQPGDPPLSGFGFTSAVLISDPIEYALDGTGEFFTAEPAVAAPEMPTGVLTMLAMAIMASGVVQRRRNRLLRAVATDVRATLRR
jgi:hypothetical protein